MNKSMRFLALLLFLVAPSCCLADPPSQAPLPKYTIHIKDEKLENLEYRCVFLDRLNDLNDSLLQPGQEIKVEARSGFSYVCHFKWQTKEKNVKLFDAEGGMGVDCVGEFDKDCIWEAREDGFWFFSSKTGWDKSYAW